MGADQMRREGSFEVSGKADRQERQGRKSPGPAFWPRQGVLQRIPSTARYSNPFINLNNLGFLKKFIGKAFYKPLIEIGKTRIQKIINHQNNGAALE
jgi:hypothetical protein